MSNKGILLRLFKEFTERDIDVQNVEDRIIMQKIVFFLDEIGITVGNYSFVLETYGPFSQNLNNDIHNISDEQAIYDGTFPEYIQNAIMYIREIVFAKHTQCSQYTLRQWLEAIASLLFLKKYSYPSCSWDSIEEKMVDLKEYLNNKAENSVAIACCESLNQYQLEY